MKFLIENFLLCADFPEDLHVLHAGPEFHDLSGHGKFFVTIIVFNMNFGRIEQQQWSSGLNG